MLVKKGLCKSIMYSAANLCFLLLLSSCTFDASIKSLDDGDIDSMNRKSPEFVYGEVVTTPSGNKIIGVFGEISEKKKAINSDYWEFEGVFYE